MADQEPSNNLIEQYEFVPEHLRHHFYRDVFRDDDDKEHHEEIRRARQTRSAYLITQLQATPTAQQANKTPVSSLYSLSVEHAITTRMTFERTLGCLREYFYQLSRDLELLEQAQPVAVPSWLYARSSPDCLPTLTQVQRKIVNAVEECLHESDIYLAMYEQLPSPPAASLTPLLRYAACSKRSNMQNKCLLCPKLLPRDSNQTEAAQPQQQQRPVSLVALDSMQPVIMDDILECAADQVHAFSPQAVTGPFACYPLISVSGQAAIGVLALDSCRKALKMRPESMTAEALSAFLTRMKLKDAAMELKRHQINGQQFLALTENELNHKPMFHKLKVVARKRLLELIHALQQGRPVHLASPPRYFIHDPAAMDFVQQVASIAGVFIDGFRGVHWHRAMANVTRDQACTAYDVYDILLRGIALSLIEVDRVALWKIDTTQNAIDVVASTQVPDDRLLPFLNWSDRQIKRLVFYKENPDSHGSLMQGTISKISFKAPPGITQDIGTSVMCEQAIYHISWSNRSSDVLSWPKLRQLLPIRQMNSKHFQLRNLIDTIQKHAKETQKASVLAISEPNGVALLVKDPKRPEEIQYVLEVDFDSDYRIPSSVNAFLTRAVRITEKSLLAVRGRESRALYRQNSTKRTTQTYNSLSIAPSAEALHGLDGIVSNVFFEILENLPGVQLQISELQPDGAQLCYTFAANGSTLLGKILNRGQGVSYRCLDTKVPLVVGKASDLRQRLRLLGSVRHESEEYESGDEDFPFVFVPLIHEDCTVGVLTVNRFVDVAKARNDEQHPEAGVLDYLASLAKVLASAIYLKRRSFALYQLQSIGLDPIRSPQQLFFHGCRLLKDVMVGAWKVRLVEVDFAHGKTTLLYDLSEAERVNEHSELVQMILPLQFRFKELLADTIGAHFHIIKPNVVELMRSVAQSVQEDEQEQRSIKEILLSDLKPNDQKRRIESQVRRRYFTLTLASLEDEQQESVAPSKPLGPQTGTNSLSTRMSNEKYINHALTMFLASKTCLYAPVASLEGKSSNVFITATNLPQFHSTCEQNYVQRIADCISKHMDDLYRRVERSRARVCALETFRRTCEQTLEESLAILDLDRIPHVQSATMANFSQILTPEQELKLEGLLSLQQQAITVIEGILNGPTVCFALLEPSLSLLKFTSASKTSVMKNKHLRKGHGVSFHVLETQEPIVVTRENAVAAQKTPVETPLESGNHFRQLRIFALDPTALKWPFICVPLGTIGVLSIQNLEKYGRLACEKQPEIGLVDFLRQMATAFAQTLAVVRQRSLKFRQRLRHNALMKVLAYGDDMKGPPAPGYMQHFVIQQIERALNGVDAYIGLVEPLCEQIQFQTASTHSRMQGQIVNTVDSASFAVFVTQRPLVIPQMQHYYENDDHEFKDKVQHRHHQLRLLGASAMRGPFVCVPIPFVGVLSVDTFPGAASGMYSRQFPEYGVLDWLTAMANHLGASIRTRNAMASKAILPTLFRGNKTTFTVLFQDILTQISNNVLAAVELQVLRFSKTTMEPKKRYAVLSRSSQGKKGIVKGATIKQLEPEILHQIHSVDDDEAMRVFALTDYPEVIVAMCEDTRDVMDDTAALDTTIIVVRRVAGAAWMYDSELLQSLLPLINDLIRQVNMRIQGIVVRRVALQQLERWGAALDDRSSHDAVQELGTMIRDGVELVAQSLSLRDDCDAYMGERQIGGEQLIFTSASSRSLMQNVSLDLANPESQALVCVQCLQQQREFVVYLLDNKNDKTLRSLSDKKVLRLYLATSMGDHRILCADSLGMEVFDVKTRKLEDDVLSFLRDSARSLEHTIMSTRFRLSYDQLMHLSTREHMNFRLYFATLLQITRRDFVVLHSQQVMALANDFTGDYKVETWHHAATRRPIATMKQHFCSLNDCEQQLIQMGVHFERHVRLPMTNLPRTLDQSRSTLEPAEGTEKRGAYTCSCLATMLDRNSLVPKFAFCVFSHDLKSRAKTSFTRTQQQYFTAFSAVASSVWTHVFRSCVLHSFGIELFCYLRERFTMKDAIVVSVQSGSKLVTVMNGSQSAKYPEGKLLIGKFADKILQFCELKAPISVGFARKMVVAPLAPGPLPTAQATTMTTSSHTQATGKKEQADKSSFFKRPNFLNRKKARKEAGGTHSPSTLAAGIQEPSNAIAQQQERIVAHVLIRALDFCGRTQIVAFDVESGSLEAAKAIEQRVREYVSEATAIAEQFLSRTPRGDEEVNGGGFGRDGGGGGFYIFSILATTQTRFRNLAQQLNADIRAYVVAMDVEIRNPLATHRNEEDDGTTPAAGAQELVFSDSNVALSGALAVVMSASMLMCGLKKEIVARCTKHELLMLFLREHITDKVLSVDPRDSTRWNALLRARTHLKAHQLELDAVQNDPKADQDKAAPVRELLTLLLVLISLVKYLRQVESETQRAQQQLSQRATVIQCLYRCVRSKARLRRLRLEFRAALKIQCAFRQHIARRRLMFKKWCRAAVKIQRAYRRKIQRRKGTRPKRLTDDLLAISRRYGGLRASVDAGNSVAQETDEWKAEMGMFNSFDAFIRSNVGLADLKREESVMHARMLELNKERKQLSEHERIMEDAKDLFELMDIEGTGELTREGMKEMIKRMRVPLEQEEADDVIAMMDSDHSGAISLSEFTNWFFHEYPLLKKRSKDCGVISKRDWQWVIEQSARSALRKRWRAVRAGRGLTPLQDDAQDTTIQEGQHEAPSSRAE